METHQKTSHRTCCVTRTGGWHTKHGAKILIDFIVGTYATCAIAQNADSSRSKRIVVFFGFDEIEKIPSFFPTIV